MKEEKMTLQDRFWNFVETVNLFAVAGVLGLLGLGLGFIPFVAALALTIVVVLGVRHTVARINEIVRRDGTAAAGGGMAALLPILAAAALLIPMWLVVIVRGIFT